MESNPVDLVETEPAPPKDTTETEATEREVPVMEEGEGGIHDDSVADPETEHESDHDGEDEDDEDGDVKPDSNLTPQQRARHAITGRGVTLSMLMADGMIEPGEDSMSIEYLGQKFTADLLADGRIRWREEDKLFGSPSAWAIHCKKIVNPMKKSGCGWASVKYKGKKLNSFKSTWTRKQHPISGLAAASTNGKDDVIEESCSDNDEPEEKRIKEETDDDAASQYGSIRQENRVSVLHGTLGRKSLLHDPNTLVECTPYNLLNKIQPFNILVSTNALLLMDFHSHLSGNEVIGYLGGKWDINTQGLSVEMAVPCIGDNKEKIDKQAKATLQEKGLKLVGWYHSHPRSQPDPSLRDIETQMEYQLAIGGPLNSYQPCLSFILSPHDARQQAKGSMETTLRVVWVMPPPAEARAMEYGMPMTLHYEIQHESHLPTEIRNRMERLVAYYSIARELMDFSTLWLPNMTMQEKFKGSLLKKLPKEEHPTKILDFVDKLLADYDIPPPSPQSEPMKVEHEPVLCGAQEC